MKKLSTRLPQGVQMRCASNKATKQQSNDATKQQSNKATKQPSNQATKQQSNKATKPPRHPGIQVPQARWREGRRQLDTFNTQLIYDANIDTLSTHTLFMVPI